MFMCAAAAAVTERGAKKSAKQQREKKECQEEFFFVVATTYVSFMFHVSLSSFTHKRKWRENKKKFWETTEDECGCQ